MLLTISMSLPDNNTNTTYSNLKYTLKIVDLLLRATST